MEPTNVPAASLVLGGHGDTRMASPPRLPNVATSHGAAALWCKAKAEPSGLTLTRCGAARVTNSKGRVRCESERGGVSQKKAG
eukprot:scaffold28948_cov29-Tisochrysis_lutea.AAC.2